MTLKVDSNPSSSKTPSTTVAGKLPAKPLNPTTPHDSLEFCGPVGAAGVVFGLPLVEYLLYFACNHNGCVSPTNLEPLWKSLASVSASDFFNWHSLAVVLGWFAFQVVLYYIVPAKIVKGTVIRNGTQLNYRINAFQCAIISLVVFFGGLVSGWIPLSFFYDNFLALLTSANILASAIALYVYVHAKLKKDVLLALGGNSGITIYDFFIGHELNPRLGDFDWKYFCELRPGLIGWALLNFGLAAKQYERQGSVHIGLVLVSIFELVYVMDALWFEQAILTTMDITTDGFGYMLAFGDLSWVPFIYSTQARYLVDHHPGYGIGSDLYSILFIAAIILIKGFGYWVFRGSNSEKNAFRTNPNAPELQHLKYIKTERGSKLLITGWWGVARHINYLGDLLMALSWCLTSGFNHIVPYFYVIYFAVLLVHRDMRDDHNCHLKYGQDWNKYKSIVKYRILPYVY